MYVHGHPGVCRPVAETAARALGAIGPSAKSAMPALLDLLRDTQGTFDQFGPDDRCDNYEARGAAAIAAAGSHRKTTSCFPFSASQSKTMRGSEQT